MSPSEVASIDFFIRSTSRRLQQILLAVFVTVVLPVAVRAQEATNGKDALYQSIAEREGEAWQTALSIWKWAEPGYQEEKSSQLLSKMLEANGFTIKHGLADIPTAFVATYGEGKPVIGILGEYDALPGMSQAAVPYRQANDGQKYGHACGHHLFGTASALASIAIAEQIKAGTISGTVHYFGCPAEEGGSAKAFMVRSGVFAQCDTILHWHPSSQNSAGDRSSLARIAVKFRFHGKAAHAAGSPEQGRSALDAVELTNHAVQLLREHIPEKSRIHHIITAGGDAPNIVPRFAEVYYYVRHPNADTVRELYRRLKLCAQAGAKATETKLEINYQGGILNLLPNKVLSDVAANNLRTLNNLSYNEEDLRFATTIQETLAKPVPLTVITKVVDRSGQVGNGSTDVGDVSWVVPTAGFTTACWVPGTPGHSWQVVAASGTHIGQQGMNLAARVLAATAWDLFTQPELITQAHTEFQRRLAGRKYRSLLKDKQTPPLDYRKPAKN